MPIMLQYVEYLAWRGRGRGLGGIRFASRCKIIVCGCFWRQSLWWITLQSHHIVADLEVSKLVFYVQSTSDLYQGDHLEGVAMDHVSKPLCLILREFNLMEHVPASSFCG